LGDDYEGSLPIPRSQTAYGVPFFSLTVGNFQYFGFIVLTAGSLIDGLLFRIYCSLCSPSSAMGGSAVLGIFDGQGSQIIICMVTKLYVFDRFATAVALYVKGSIL